MMRQEWIDRAKEYERKAQEAYDRGDTIAGEMYEAKASACYSNADYGTEVEYPENPK